MRSARRPRSPSQRLSAAAGGAHQPETLKATTGYLIYADLRCGVRIMTGQYDPATKSITYTGQMDDIVKPGTKVNVRQVIRIVSPDSYVMEWYETRDGKEAKIMEIAYSRAK